MTMTLIETITVGASVSSFTFSSVPQSATDLVILLSARTNADGDVYIRFNSNGTGYVHRDLFLNNTSVSSQTYGSTSSIKIGECRVSVASTFNNSQIYIGNYSGNAFKNVSAETVNGEQATGNSLGIWAGTWSNTAAITSITFLLPGTNTFSQYTSASLYSITKGSGGATVS